MTGREIQSAARQYCDYDISDSDVLAAINDAIQWLGPYSELYDSIVISADNANQWYALPQDAITVVEVKNSDGYNITDFITRGGSIFLPDTGTYTVFYKKMPKTLLTLDETPNIHSLYHPCLVTYVSAWWKLKYDETNQDGTRLMIKFERDVLRVYQSLRSRHYSTEVKVFR